MAKQTDEILKDSIRLTYSRYAPYNRFVADGIREVFLSPSLSFGESLVDRTNFRPTSEDVRAHLLSSQGLGSTVQGVYDFMDGKDTGYRPYRDIGADPVDVLEYIKSLRKEISDLEASEKSDEITKARLKQLGDAIAESLNTYGATEASESDSTAGQ